MKHKIWWELLFNLKFQKSHRHKLRIMWTVSFYLNDQELYLYRLHYYLSHSWMYFLDLNMVRIYNKTKYVTLQALNAWLIYIMSSFKRYQIFFFTWTNLIWWQNKSFVFANSSQKALHPVLDYHLVDFPFKF